MAEEERRDDIIRLEERTRSLESSEKRHYLIEMILLLAFLSLALMFVSGCEINTPGSRNDDGGTRFGGDWVYTATEDGRDLEDVLSFEVVDGGKSVTVICDGEVVGDVENADGIEVKALRTRIGAVFEERKITIYIYDGTTDQEGLAIGTFELK